MTEVATQPGNGQVHDAITERMIKALEAGRPTRCAWCGGPITSRHSPPARHCSTRCGHLSRSKPRQLRDDAVQLASGEWALVSPEDLEAVREYRWVLHAGSYARCGSLQPEGMHRFVLARKLGRDLFKGEEAEHKNGNGLDNRRSNLRPASRSENMRNQRNVKHGVTGYIGVSFGHTIKVSYRSYLTLDDAQVHIGSFDTAEEAAWMRDQWALALHKEFAVLNFEYLPARPSND